MRELYASYVAQASVGSLGGQDRLTSYVLNDDATPWPIVDITSGPITVGAGGLHVIAGLSSADEIEIGVGSNAQGIGINYINFDVSPVPEPESWVLLMAGLAMIGVRVRRRGMRGDGVRSSFVACGRRSEVARRELACVALPCPPRWFERALHGGQMFGAMRSACCARRLRAGRGAGMLRF